MFYLGRDRFARPLDRKLPCRIAAAKRLRVGSQERFVCSAVGAIRMNGRTGRRATESLAARDTAAGGSDLHLAAVDEKLDAIDKAGIV